MEKKQLRNKLREQKKRKVEYLQRRETRENETDNLGIDSVSKMVAAIKTHDRELPTTFDREPRVYGKVSIGEDERSALRLPPKFTLFEEVNKEQCNVEIETMVAKYRWELRKEWEMRKKEKNKNDVSNVSYPSFENKLRVPPRQDNVNNLTKEINIFFWCPC